MNKGTFTMDIINIAKIYYLISFRHPYTSETKIYLVHNSCPIPNTIIILLLLMMM